MQLLRSLTKAPQKAPQKAPRRSPVSAMLPYVGHVDDATVASRDGRLHQVVRVRGFAFETADSDEIAYRKHLRDGAFRAIAAPNLTLHHHIIRREVQPHLEGEHSSPFARTLNAAWASRLESRRLFVNELYFTITRAPPRGRLGVVEQILGATDAVDAAGRARDRRELDTASETLLAVLEPYGARRLRAYRQDGEIHSEPLEFFALLFNGDWRPVRLDAPAPPAPPLADHRISFGPNALELYSAQDGRRTFAAVLGLREYPPFTEPGLFDALFRLPFEMTMSQSFEAVDRQAGLDQINLAIRRLRAADDDAVSLRAQLAQAKDDLAAGRQAFGHHHLSLMVKADTLQDLDRVVADARAALSELGAIAVREDAALEPAFWAQFPGNGGFIPRRALVSSGNFASLASAHNHPLGQADGAHWGPALTVLETTAASPYHFNFHRGDLGNFLVIGPSGSGKTAVIGFLLAQAQKYEPRIFLFDKDRGAEIVMRALGASYAELKPGMATGFNPLLLQDTPANRRFLSLWTARLVSAGQTLAPEDQAMIDAAIAANFDQPPAYRRLRYFREALAGARRPDMRDLAARLAPWVEAGAHAWLFDNEADTFAAHADLLGYDMTSLLDDPVTRTPAMMYLFHRIEERLDGRPTIIVVDEGWKALDDAVFVAQIRDWEKTIRKRNGIVGFATQSAQDALESQISSAIIEQSAVQIFLPNPKAREAEYREGFGLTAHEFDLVKSLPDTSRCMLIKSGRESVVVRLDLGDMPQVLAVLAGSERSVRALDAARAQAGDDPAAWMPMFLRGLT